MQHLLILTAAMATSLAVIPLMMRLAAPLGLVDEPADRKVHAGIIPRVGGWGIFAGALVTTLYWLPLDETIASYLIAGAILFAFGVWDDRKEIGHYAKFGGQVAAVLVVVVYGQAYVTHLPFVEQTLSPPLGMFFTAFALIGMINAANHADGLDGLAGGEGLLSLGAMALVAYFSGLENVVVIAVACSGALLGFLRFNTHPARLFMGDGGSQFLGLTLGFLAVLLAERAEPSISPAAVVLVLGFPIADILMVLGKRMRGGMNWFRATRNHVHHRLLDLGFVHREAVVIIYGIQSVSVVAGYFLRYDSDWLILSVYLLMCGVVFGLLAFAEHNGWSARADGKESAVAGTVSFVRHVSLVVLPRKFLGVALPVFFVLGSLWAAKVPEAFGWAALALLPLAMLEPVATDGMRPLISRLYLYSVAGLVVYLLSYYQPRDVAWSAQSDGLFFLLVVVALALAVKFSPRRRHFEFRPTSLDYLVSLAVLSSVALLASPYTAVFLTGFVVRLVIAFYACELLIIEGRMRWGGLNIAAVSGLSIIAVRGLF